MECWRILSGQLAKIRPSRYEWYQSSFSACETLAHILLFGIGTIVPEIAFADSIHAGHPSYWFYGFVSILMLCLMAWYWAIRSFLNPLIQQPLRPTTAFFPCALIFPLLYLLLFNIFFDQIQPLMLIAIVPIHFLAMYSGTMRYVFPSLVLSDRGMDYATARQPNLCRISTGSVIS